MRDAGLRENEGGTSNSGCSDPFSPFAVTAVQQGVEERQLQQGHWQRERHFLLTLAVRAFPSVTGCWNPGFRKKKKQQQASL